MPQDLPRDLTERVRSVLRGRPEVVFAYLFGSRAEDRAHGTSDVDVAVYLSEDDGGDGTGSRDDGAGGTIRDEAPKAAAAGDGRAGRGRLETWSGIHGDLVEALASVGVDVGPGHRGHAPEGVDLVVLNDASPLLAERVLRGGELLVSRSEPARIRWTVRAKSRYCDLVPLRRRLDRAVSERLRTGRFGRRGPERGSSASDGSVDGRPEGSEGAGG